MCGRFVIFSSIRKIALEFSVDPGDMAFSPAYNIAPSQEMLIILSEGDRKIIRCRWGFIPPWAKDPHVVNFPGNDSPDNIKRYQELKAG